MESPREKLRSSQSRRKVRFRNNYINENNNDNSNKQNILEQGLDLSLFEGSVDQDLICAICSRVFVQPEVSSCQHVFCSSCLHNNIGKECPTCCIPLDRTPSNQPPVHLRLKLLDLVIRCDNKCGKVLALGKLPRHVSAECPNTPVPCPYSKRGGTGGCQIKVKRCQLLDHTKECDWRPVQCEACGEKTVFNDLVLHQKRSRCVENRIRNQLVQAMKSTHQEATRHRKNLEHQRVKIESHQRRNELDHGRRLQSMKTQKRQGSWHPHNHHQQRQSLNNESSLSSSSFTDYSNSSSKNSGAIYSNYIDNNKQRQAISSSNTPKLLPINTPSHQINNTNNNNLNDTITNDINNNRPGSQQFKETSTLALVPTSTTSVMHNQSNVNVFFTSTDVLDGEIERGNGAFSVPPSRHGYIQDNQFICKKCNKRARESCNKSNSCRWHAGPIIELFGGTCYTCGRLDYQHGCMTGYHEK